MAILHDGLDEYIQKLIPDRPETLRKMEDYAEQNGFPIVGPQVGQVLMQYARLTSASKIFELGSGYGYSAMWFARATAESTKIYCTDNDPENKKQAKKYLEREGYWSKIEFLIGDAISSFKQVKGEFDIIFNDINKDQYPEVFDIAIPQLRKGGLLISDNTLWSGNVVKNNPTIATQGILEYNQKAFKHEGLISMILPIRDGVTVSYKL